MKTARTYHFHDREDPRFVIVVPVRSDAQIDFFLERIRLVCRGDFKDTIPVCVISISIAALDEDKPIRRRKRNILP